MDITEVDNLRGFEDVRMLARASIVFLGLLVSLAGCALTPTLDELAKADYGTPVSQEQAEAKATAVLQQVLHDPGSARIAFQPVGRGYFREGLFYGGKLYFGYILDAKVNTKNFLSFYTGDMPYTFVLFNGEVVLVYGQPGPLSDESRLYKR